MTKTQNSMRLDNKSNAKVAKKENNPFSEQEKHGDEAQKRRPRTKQEAQGGSVQPPPSTGKRGSQG